MMRRFSRWDWTALGLMALGAYFRLYPLFHVRFDEPFHLGGLFYEFSRQIALNNFALPEVIPFYSAGGIPFAYPPLGFYVQAVLLKLFNPPLFVTVNLIPPFVAVLSLPAFYWLAKHVSDDMPFAVSALAVFALLPAAFSNQIEAAGLAESFGLLALIMYTGWLFRFEQNPRPQAALTAAMGLALCVLSSPGSAYGGALVSVLFFFKILFAGFKTGQFAPAGWLVLTGLFGAALSAPYWLTVIQHHGFDLFLTPFLSQNGENFPQRLAALGNFDASGSDLGILWNWLGFGGLLWALLNKRGFLALFLLTFWLVPREGTWLVAIPASLLAAHGFLNILLPLVQKSLPANWTSRPSLAPGLLAIAFLGLAYADANVTLNQMFANDEWRITARQVQSLETLRASLPEGARVLVAGSAALNEWAPQILQREVLNEMFGTEWQPGEAAQIAAINEALNENDLEAALSALEDYTGDRHIYLLASANALSTLGVGLPEETVISPVASTPELSLSLVEKK